MKRHARTTLTTQEAGRPLLDWMAGRFSYKTTDGWRDVIEDGRVHVNGQPTDESYLTSAGDQVEYFPDAKDEPAVILSYDVVFEDDRLLVVNKPPNLPCHPSGSFFKNTLWALLTDAYGEIYIINRLDRETSGLILVARDKLMAKELGNLFSCKEITKDYLVLVHGEFGDNVRCEGFLVPDGESPVRKKKRFQLNPEDDAIPCCTSFERLAFKDGLSLVQAKPETGKFHQIRATSLALGFPVVGDKIYGLDDSIFVRFVDHCMTEEDDKELILTHQALHAWRLNFSLVDYGDVSFQATLPPDFLKLLKDRGIAYDGIA